MDDVDDVVQEVALVLQRRVQAGRLPAARPCVHRFLDRTITLSAKHARRARLGRFVFGSGEDDMDDFPAAETTLEYVEVHRDELLERLRTWATALPSSYREVVELTIDGLEPAHIAERLALNPGTVRVRLHRAKAMLLALQASSASEPTGLSLFYAAVTSGWHRSSAPHILDQSRPPGVGGASTVKN